MKLNVFLNMYGKRTQIGVLVEQESRIFFQYTPDFVQSGFELSPFKLPLKVGVFEDEKRTFEGLFGLFNDSLPDGWGCLLLDRKLMSQGLSYNSITPLQRLSMIGKNPMGALEYEPSSDNIQNNFEYVELDSLSMEADNILSGNPTEALDELLKLNGSSAGARPKIVAFVSDDMKQIKHGGQCDEGFSPWLIKFSNHFDRKDLGVQEYVYSLMAKKAGIEMSETYLFASKNCSGHFGVKRFDRIKNEKIHVHMACGLLHASHRVSSIDYESLLRLTWTLTKDYQEVLKMVRLMIFNVKAGNKDDHSKNFAFMLDKAGNWKMAPAYDLTPSQGINGEQTAMVNGKGRDITDDDLITAAGQVNVGQTMVREMIVAVEESLSDYSHLMKQF